MPLLDMFQQSAMIKKKILSRGNSPSIDRREVKRMKKTLSEEALAQEATFWDSLKNSTKENPGKVCHK